MDKDKSELAEFLGDLSNTSSEELKPAEDPFEKKEEVIEEEVEKPLPFNKDPKVQKFIEKEISRRLADFKPEPQTAQTGGKDEEFDNMLTELIGNQTPQQVAMIQKFGTYLKDLPAKAKAEALAELEARQNEEVEADMEAENERDEAFDRIEQNFDVDLTSNNKLAVKLNEDFREYCAKIAPKDRYGEIIEFPDFDSAWEEFSEKRKLNAQPNRAKDLASRGMRNSAETTVSGPQGRSTFEAAERYIENLK